MAKVSVLILWILLLWNVKEIELIKNNASSKYPPLLLNVKECVRQFVKDLGVNLYNLSSTMTRKAQIQGSFNQLKNKIHYKEEEAILNAITGKLKDTMFLKMKAVQNIAEYAEFLAYYRKKEYIDPNSNFGFYNADNITNSTYDWSSEKNLEDELQQARCSWWCDQQMYARNDSLKCNIFDNITMIEKLFGAACDCSLPMYRSRTSLESFNYLPLKSHPNYGDTEVNFNLSVVKIATQVYAREQEVLQGVRWTEPLDMIFIENQEMDPTLKYQYFASPHGYMRHYPALKWSDERYAQTYDPRTRSWYTEAMTSPKDIVILLDSSGSVIKLKRKVATLIVNNILDTLNDNDFVNIYLFANSTVPLVPCFRDTLVQANEENLRLLRETLDNYEPRFQAEIEVGLEKAFKLLAKAKKEGSGSGCNQAVMLITEDAFFKTDDQKEFFEEHNTNRSVRVFTYQLEKSESDARLLEWIACYNKGYFVNISLLQEVREKALPYLSVMSRPINFQNKEVPMRRDEFIWSYLYIDLADRRYTNWLWKKFEGNRQRAIFLDHAKREYTRLGRVLSSESHFLLKESHDYEKYEKPNDYDYMTTLSLPVYSRLPEDVELIGVAAVDIPIKLLYSLIPHHTIGVNGYAFIVTNNGYILMHPGHKREFENIPKPTFNRVDLLEVETLDDTNKPRQFGDPIKNLRNNILERQRDPHTLNVKYALDGMKRIMRSKRRYVFTHLGDAFHVGIALPDTYGLMVVNVTNVRNYERALLNTKNWTVHPDWVYCDGSGETPEEVIKDCLKNKKLNEPLMKALLNDAELTKWFEDDFDNQDYFVKTFLVDNVFISTHSGLTRWKTFSPETYVEQVDDDDEKTKKEIFRGNRSIDEDWYKRVVEENLGRNDDIFIYSVPFEISGYEWDTMITSTSAIFVVAEHKKSPVAAVGVQFYHDQMARIYNSTTKKCRHQECNCESDHVSCFILDNNAYVIFGQTEHTGRFIGDVSPFITNRLIKNKVYQPIEMYDYQAICQKPPEGNNNSGGRVVLFFRTLLENLLNVTNWAFATIMLLISSVSGGKNYQSNKNDTLLYEKLQINKTVPTPCDQQMWLFTLNDNFAAEDVVVGKPAKAGCDWYYYLERIPHSNLVFLAINPVCDTVSHSQPNNMTPTPVEIDYDVPLACYIAENNNFPRKFYKKCYNYSEYETPLNHNHTYCGHTWSP